MLIVDNPNEITMSTEEEYLEVWVKQDDDLDLDSQPSTSTATEPTVPATEVIAPEDPASDQQPWDSRLSGVRQPGSKARQQAVSEASRRLVEERREFLSLQRALMLEENRNKKKLNEEKMDLLNLRRTLMVEEYDNKRRLGNLEEEYLKLKLKKLQE